MLPRLLLSVAALAAALSVRAQRLTTTAPDVTPPAIESATVTVEITGRIAVTTFDCTLRNPNSRVLEGNFELPLLDGQTVNRFALDVNGALREGVPVDKPRATAVFEEIERRGIDPGLAEKTAGNTYRVRVYPLPARGTRRIVLAYQETLPAASPAAYRLNLAFAEPLKTFQLDVRVFGGGMTAATARTTLDLPLDGWRDQKALSVRRENFRAQGILELTLPALTAPAVITGRRDGTQYFVAEVPLSLPPRPRPTPRVVGLLWDSSGSGQQRNHAAEFALLDAWFAALGPVEVRLVRLRDVMEDAGRFTVTRGDWSPLRAELEHTIYDGATSLEGLRDQPDVTEWLLISDGLLNYGASASSKLSLHGVIHTALSSAPADGTWLRAVAQRSGGEFVNLTTTSSSAAAAILRTQSPRVIAVERDPQQVAQVFPEEGMLVGPGPLTAAGVLTADSATVRLRVGYDAATARDLTFTVHAGENDSRLAPSGWAAQKIAALSLDFAANRADIRRTAQAFGIVTDDTSLLVLETLQDYIRYEIEPPAELREEWQRWRSTQNAAQAKTRDEHLEEVVRLFAAKQQWWEKTYPTKKPTPSEDETPGNIGALAVVSGNHPRRPDPNATALEPSGGAPANADDDVQTLSPLEVTADEGHRRERAVSAARANVQAAAEAASLARASEARLTFKRGETASGSTITLRPWSPQTGYLDRFKRTPAAQRYAIYLEERREHTRQPGFFLDMANAFFEAGDTAHALRILSNLAELESENVPMLRVLGLRLMQAARPDLALPLFERVLMLRPDEPQSRRDLALAHAALRHFQRAADLLIEIVNQPWDARFPEIELIALGELNALVATCGEPVDLSRLDSRLRRNLPCGLRAVLSWDANDCDIDLWVVDPNDETAKYDHPLTYQGGRMSRDFTRGYGPEEFLLRKPKPGKYRVRLNYFGDARQTALGPVTAQVRLITGFGTPAEKEQVLTVRLTDKKEELDIGEIEIGQ